MFRKLAVSCAILCGILALFIAINFSPPGAEIVCNRAIDSAIQQWRLENNTTGYPNIRGKGEPSLALITNYLGQLRDYYYVPGLQEDDPKDLILLYVKESSRRYWHGQGWSPVRAKRWVVLPVGCGGEFELAEALETVEFRKRLEGTLEFLEKNSRPHWETIVSEHRRFLDSIRD